MGERSFKALFFSAAVFLTLSLPALAAERGGFAMEVLVGGRPTAEYQASGKVYVEALRGREYAIRLTNSYPCRVAVALSVDGLNTIDARRTEASSARKWVLEPYETVVISGWQISGEEARKFFFTGEKRSYGAFLGQTENLGLIEAVVYRERRPQPTSPPCPRTQSDEGEGSLGGASGAPAPQASSPRRESSSESKAAPGLSDDYAATGIGGRMRHEVTQIAMELEERPSSVVSVRYEFRPQLISLGVLPRPRPTPMQRREHASGFEQAYCPDPYGQAR